MNYVIDIDDTICIPGATEETKYTGATPILDRIAKINKLYDDGNRILYLTARGMGKYKILQILHIWNIMNLHESS